MTYVKPIRTSEIVENTLIYNGLCRIEFPDTLS